MRSLSLDDGPEVTFSPSTTGTIGGAGCVQSLDDEQEVTPSLSTLVTGTVARRFVLFCFVLLSVFQVTAAFGLHWWLEL